MLKRFDGVWTQGTHITFRNLGNYWGGEEHKTNQHDVLEKGNVSSRLGRVFWFARWRKYVFEATPGAVFEETCMREISEFIESETKAHRTKKAEEKRDMKSYVGGARWGKPNWDASDPLQKI